MKKNLIVTLGMLFAMPSIFACYDEQGEAAGGYFTTQQAHLSPLWQVLERVDYPINMDQKNAELRRLLAEGADPNESNGPDRITPLMRAATLGDTEMVQILLEAGADPTLSDINGKTALDFATKPEIRQILAEYLKTKLP